MVGTVNGKGMNERVIRPRRVDHSDRSSRSNTLPREQFSILSEAVENDMSFQ
jgi:hypothetical protein